MYTEEIPGKAANYNKETIIIVPVKSNHPLKNVQVIAKRDFCRVILSKYNDTTIKKTVC